MDGLFSDSATATMRKLPAGNRFASFPSVALYRDDLEEIIGMLGDSSDRVTISDNEYEFDSLDEISKIRGLNLHSLVLARTDPFVQLSFRRRGEEHSIALRSESSDNATAIFHKLSEKLKSRRRILSLLFYPWVWIPLSFIVVVAVCDPDEEKVTIWQATAADWAGLVTILAMGAGVTVSILMQQGALFKLSLARPHESKSWLKENAERCLLVFVGAIIGSLGTAVTTWVLKLISDHSAK